MTERSTAKDSARSDPFEAWRQFYEANEQVWTKAIKEVITTQGYAEAQGKLLETFLTFQKMMRDAMTSQLNTFNLPTRDDIARLGELIVGVEEKVDQLHERLDDLEDRSTRQGQRVQNGQVRGRAEAMKMGAARGRSGGARSSARPAGQDEQSK